MTKTRENRNPMKSRLIPALLLAACSSLAMAQPASAPSDVPSLTDLPEIQLGAAQAPALLDDPVGTVERYLRQVSSFKANFLQMAPDGQIARGTMYLQRPGRVRFEYEPEVPLLIVSDGKVLSFVDYDVGQVTRWPVRETPLALLLEEPDQVLERIEILQSGPGPLPGTVRIKAQDRKNPSVGQMTLAFRAGAVEDAVELTGWQVHDPQGLVTTITLSEAEINTTIGGNRFSFDDPRRKRRGRR